jgi:hypothetical protein
MKKNIKKNNFVKIKNYYIQLKKLKGDKQ